MRKLNEAGYIFAILPLLLGIVLCVSAFLFNYIAGARTVSETQKTADQFALKATDEIASGLNRIAELNLLLKGILASVLSLEGATVLSGGTASPATLKAISMLMRISRTVAKAQEILLKATVLKVHVEWQAWKRKLRPASLALFPPYPLYPKEMPATLELHVRRRPPQHPGIPGYLELENHFLQRQYLRVRVTKRIEILKEQSLQPKAKKMTLQSEAFAAPIGAESLMTPQWRSALISPYEVMHPRSAWRKKGSR